MKRILPSLLLPALLAVNGCHKPAETTESNDIRVTSNQVVIAKGSAPASSITAVAPSTPIAASLNLNGRLVWDDNVTTRLFTPFSGRVIKCPIGVGESVKTGTTLALIASPDYGQARADARKAEADLMLAERTLARVRELYDHGAAPQKDLQSAEADQARARSEQKRATERLALYGEHPEGEEQLFAFRSPMAGILVEKNINPGAELRADLMLANAAQLAAPQFVVTDPERLWVQIDVPERDQAKVRAGQSFTIRSANLPGKTFSGRIDVVGDGLDQNTRTIKARGSLANPGRLLKSEMFVLAELTIAPESGVAVPVRAVFLRGEKHCVIVEDSPGHYSRREVTIGSEVNGQILITSALEPGLRVVTDGAILLEQLLSSNP